MESSELHTHRDTGGCCIRGNLATRYPSTRHPGPIFETLEELKPREAEEWPFCQNRDFDDLVYESTDRPDHDFRLNEGSTEYSQWWFMMKSHNKFSFQDVQLGSNTSPRHVGAFPDRRPHSKTPDKSEKRKI